MFLTFTTVHVYNFPTYLSMVSDLIDDTKQTLNALNDARESIQDLQATDSDEL